MKPIIMYRFAISGHCHRVELMLALLKLPVQLVEVDVVGGEHRRAPFLELNPFGQVPVLDDNGVVISDSNAILVYLATRYASDGPWLPREPVAAAAVQRWLSIAAGPLAYGPAVARIAALFKRPMEVETPRLVARQLFERMDAQLGARRYLAAANPTLADVAMYAYVAHAPEGGVSLQPYTHVRRWLTDIEAWPEFVPMQHTETSERTQLAAAGL